VVEIFAARREEDRHGRELEPVRERDDERDRHRVEAADCRTVEEPRDAVARGEEPVGGGAALDGAELRVEMPKSN
jgi:hypothetical protein